MTVGIAGTGGGFDRFCVGETDLSNASRPIDEDEAQKCADAGIEYVELPVANDALTVVVNSENDWATCLTVEQLKAIWEPGSKVDNWQDVDPSFPDEPLRLYGPGTDSGTFDYFTDVIVGEEGESRTDFQASEDDNVIIEGVTGDTGALGYFGFSYYEQNQDTVNAVEVDSGSGCVAPSVATAQDGTYAPLSRPLFVYVKASSLERAEVAEFLGYMIENGAEIAEQADFVPLTPAQLAASKAKLDAALNVVVAARDAAPPISLRAPRRRYSEDIVRIVLLTAAFVSVDYDVRHHHLAAQAGDRVLHGEVAMGVHHRDDVDPSVPRRTVRRRPIVRRDHRHHVLGVPRRDSVRPRHGHLPQRVREPPGALRAQAARSRCWRGFRRSCTATSP